MISRRTFLGTLAATAVGARAGSLGAQAGDRLPLAFSTLGCPAWSWRTVLDFAVEHGYSAIELRGLQGTMDLSARPEFAEGRIEQTRRELAERGLRVVCLGSSAQMHERDPARRAAQMDEARRFIELARRLDAPFVRVFGDRFVEGTPRDAQLAYVAEGLRQLGEHAAGKGVTVLLEAHGDFTDSATLSRILTLAGSPGVQLLWDAHHTFASGGEDPVHTVRELGRWIRHTHLKDSRPDGKERRYVLTGAGDVPVVRQVEALRAAGYTGYYSFEWEKAWHPEIEEPEVALAHFARLMRERFGAGR